MAAGTAASTNAQHAKRQCQVVSYRRRQTAQGVTCDQPATATPLRFMKVPAWPAEPQLPRCADAESAPGILSY
jgi:hypothetical protein